MISEDSDIDYSDHNRVMFQTGVDFHHERRKNKCAHAWTNEYETFDIR